MRRIEIPLAANALLIDVELTVPPASFRSRIRRVLVTQREGDARNVILV